MKKKNIFIVGADEFNLHELSTINHAEKYNFITLLAEEEIHRQDVKPDVRPLIAKAKRKLDNFQGSIDGIIGFFDFPVTLVTFFLIQEYNLPGPTLESGIRCENKFISRTLQSGVIKEHIPRFRAVNPYEVKKIEEIGLEPPFWLKPVKAFGSQIGFKIDDQKDLDEALPIIREEIDFFADPYDYLASYAVLPGKFKTINGYYCIAEELIGGHQCTLSGFIYDNKVETYGIIDSINYPNSKSFFYYLLPSELPGSVQQRMADIAAKVIPKHGLDCSPFNIEFYYDEEKDKIYLLEINPRMSQSHSDLYNKVTGHSNHQVLVHLSMGKHPEFKHQKGDYEYGAKLHFRVFHDGIIEQYPGEKEIEKVKEKYPDAYLKLEAEEGQKLSDLPGQDSYSYRIAVIYTGANSKEELMDKYHDIIKELNIKIKKI